MKIEGINEANNTATVTLTVSEIYRLRTAVIQHRMDCLEDGLFEAAELDNKLAHELFMAKWNLRK